MPNPKTYILDDLPTDKDALDFTPYVETLVDVCKTASTPLTIGVFGTWGSGKTSLMRMIFGEMDPQGGEITRIKTLRIGYLPQDVTETGRGRVLESLLAGIPGKAEIGRASCRERV